LYAVRPVKTKTPIEAMAMSSALECRKMFSTDAMMRPITPMNRNEPQLVMSRLVTRPKTLIAANMPAETANACTIDARV
jgi:hypothetical protein